MTGSRQGVFGRSIIQKKKCDEDKLHQERWKDEGLKNEEAGAAISYQSCVWHCQSASCPSSHAKSMPDCQLLQTRPHWSTLPIQRHDDTPEEVRAVEQDPLSDASSAIILLLNFAVDFADFDT